MLEALEIVTVIGQLILVVIMTTIGLAVYRNSLRAARAAENTEKIMSDATRHLSPREFEGIAKLYDREEK